MTAERNRQHGQKAVPLLERKMKHGMCPVERRPRTDLVYQILSDCGWFVKAPWRNARWIRLVTSSLEGFIFLSVGKIERVTIECRKDCPASVGW